MHDEIAEIALFGSLRPWETNPEGKSPLDRATSVRESLRAVWREAKAQRVEILADTDLSDTGKQKSIAQIAAKLDQLNAIQKKLSPTEFARGQLIGHRRQWEEAQPGDPVNGAEIRSWLTVDPVENLIRLDKALADDDVDTANALMYAPRSWPGAVDMQSIQAAKDHLYAADHPEKAAQFAVLDDAVKAVEADAEFVRGEIQMAAGVETEPAFTVPLAS